VSFEALLQELKDPYRALPVSKLVHLSGMGAAQASSFLDVWLELDDRRRLRLVQDLIDLAEDNVELNFDTAFFIALADRDAGVRRAAILGLWEYEGGDLIDPLIGLLESDPDAAVRAEAALALGRFVIQAEFGRVRATQAARVDQALRLAAADEGEIPEVRARAVESIGARSAAWVRELIEEAFDSPERRLRLSAVHAMGRSCDASWVDALIAELDSDDPEMRFEAATACGAIGDEVATPYLLPLLRDDDVEVQEAAIQALGEIGGEEARDALQELTEARDERIRDAARAALEAARFAEDPLAFSV
jgi:HEAT repeat protein